MAGNFFRGTNAEQDSRWGGDKALMKKMERADMFSKVLESKVDLRKVNIPVISKWVTGKITQLLGYEDDIVIGTCINFLEVDGKLDPRKLQMQLTGFLEKQTRQFMEELWTLLIDAQSSRDGIPSVFLEQKAKELKDKGVRAERHRYSDDKEKRHFHEKESKSSDKRRESRWGESMAKTSDSRERAVKDTSRSNGESNSPVFKRKDDSKIHMEYDDRSKHSRSKKRSLSGDRRSLTPEKRLKKRLEENSPTKSKEIEKEKKSRSFGERKFTSGESTGANSKLIE